MGRIGAAELVFIALIVILLFGAKKLPEIGQAVGKALREFRNAGKELDQDSRDSSHEKKS